MWERSVLVVLIPLSVACAENKGPPACSSGPRALSTMIAGPGDPGYDQSLAALARAYDRQHLALSALPLGLATEIQIGPERTAARAAITRFMRESDGFDFSAFSGVETATVVDAWNKAVGAFAGASLAADAFRYGVLRDSGASCEEVAGARAALTRGLSAFHIAVEITGTPGVIARSLVDLSSPHQNMTLVPLKDAEGRPLPLEKDNGTWRADNSGKHPTLIWEDSCSRDMYIGWMMALGSAWEVIGADDSIDAALKATLQADALALAQTLMKVQPSGYDLEIQDADGRATFHGIMNENAFDRLYLDGAANGFYASMSLGSIAVLSYVSQDPGVRRYLEEELINKRKLPELAATDMVEVDLGLGTNFSNYNMAFTGAHLAVRYVDHAAAEVQLKAAIRDQLYQRPGMSRQPSEMAQSFYDEVMAAALAGSTADPTRAPDRPFDEAALGRATHTLSEFVVPPAFDAPRTNCDEAEIAAARCTLDDGTVVGLLGYVGRGDKLVADVPIPMRVRPPSNFHWRSNPYEPNGGSGDRLMPGYDFRLAYWLGRWVRRAAP